MANGKNGGKGLHANHGREASPLRHRPDAETGWHVPKLAAPPPDEDGGEVVRNGVRWASNILAELLGNYGRKMDPRRRAQLGVAVASLGDFMAPLAPVGAKREGER